MKDVYRGTVRKKKRKTIFMTKYGNYIQFVRVNEKEDSISILSREKISCSLFNAFNETSKAEVFQTFHKFVLQF